MHAGESQRLRRQQGRKHVSIALLDHSNKGELGVPVGVPTGSGSWGPDREGIYVLLVLRALESVPLCGVSAVLAETGYEGG